MPSKKRAQAERSPALKELAETSPEEKPRPKNVPRSHWQPLLISNLFTAALLLLLAIFAHHRGLLSWSATPASAPDGPPRALPLTDELSERLRQLEQRLEGLELAATDLGALRDEVADAMRIDGPPLAPAEIELDLPSGLSPDPDPGTPAVEPAPSRSDRAAVPKEPTAEIMVPLLMIKERNRLTSFADSAIASGNRRSYERLLEALDDPSLAYLGEAARTEILRVYRFYFEGSRLRYHTIEPSAIFSDSQIESEEQLDRHHLLAIVADLSLPWQDRTKAALLLGEHPELDTLDALVDSIRDDPVLDVVREATFSFIQITGQRFELFDVTTLLDWWAGNRLPFATSIGADPSLAPPSDSREEAPEDPSSPAPEPAPQ